MRKITFLLVTMFTLSLIGQVKLTTALHEFESGGVWMNSAKETFLYDANNNLSSKNFQFWDDQAGDYRYSELFTYTYNSSNMLNLEILKVWDSGAYVDNIKNVYNYNSENKLIESLSYFRVGTDWVNANKSIYSYNSEGKRTGDITYTWSGSDWLPANRRIISYGTNTRVANVTSEVYNVDVWVKSSDKNYTYNAINKLMVELHRNWNGTAYADNLKYEYGYDTNGNLISKKVYYANNGKLELNYEEINAFDTSLQMSSFTHPFLETTGLQYEFVEFPYINKVLNLTYENQRITYNYGENTAFVTDFNTLSFTVYPNPTNSVLKVDDSSFTLKNLEVYNLLGKKLLTTTKNELNLEGLVNGVYLIKIQDKNGNFTIKRIVKN